MRKLAHSFWIAAGVAAGLFAIVLLALNLYVQGKGTQARIQQELSRRIGTTLRIQRISITPWYGLKLTGITIPQGATSLQGNFLTAKTFRLRIGITSLFKRQLLIKEVSLIRPKVVWAQNDDGKWRLPSEEAPSPAPGHPIKEGTIPPGIEPDSPDAPPPPPVLAKPTPPPAGFVPEIRRVKVKGGEFHFLNREGKVVAKFLDLNFRSNFRSAVAVEGLVKIANASIRDRVFLQGMQSSLQYDPALLAFSDVKAQLAGGTIKGEFSMRPQEENSPFQAALQFNEIDADKVITQAGGPDAVVYGRLEGSLDARGRTADPDALAGHGEIHLRQGRVQKYSLLVALGQILQIEELSQLNFDEAHIKFRIEPRVVLVDELLFRSQNIRLSAKGTVSFEGKLRLESQLAVSDQVGGTLFGAIRRNFSPTAEPGFSAVDFNVRGTVAKPKTNLVDKLVGRDLKDLGGIVSGLFGKGRPAREREAEPDTKTPEAPPAPPPSP